MSSGDPGGELPNVRTASSPTVTKPTRTYRLPGRHVDAAVQELGRVHHDAAAVRSERLREQVKLDASAAEALRRAERHAYAQRRLVRVPLEASLPAPRARVANQEKVRHGEIRAVGDTKGSAEERQHPLLDAP